MNDLDFSKLRTVSQNLGIIESVISIALVLDSRSNANPEMNPPQIGILGEMIFRMFFCLHHRYLSPCTIRARNAIDFPYEINVYLIVFSGLIDIL